MYNVFCLFNVNARELSANYSYMLFEHGLDGLNGLFLYHLIEICVWSLRIKYLVTVHDCNQVLGVT